MSTNTWQHRGGPMRERLGLLDAPKGVKYKRTPVFLEPTQDLKPKGLTAMGFTGGVGSMLVGAKSSGFTIAGNIEWRDYYRYLTKDKVNTFTLNYPGAFMSRGWDDAPKDLIPTTIDYAVGHPECGMYSLLAKSLKDKSKNFTARESDVGDLPLFLEYVRDYQPRFFLMDDLPKSFAALPMSSYHEMLPEYDLFPEWISNWGYGNIQKWRNRMFMVGSLKSEKFTFQPGEVPHTLVLRDVIADLADNTGQGILNHGDVDLTVRSGRFTNMRHYGDRPTYAEIQEMALFTDPLVLKNKPYFSEAGIRKVRPGTTDPKWDGPCPVLSGGYNPLHPLRGLPISIRERARIQGFPDDFIFHHDDLGPTNMVWDPYTPGGQRGVKQTGKAMPIQFCEFVAKQVAAHIKGKKFPVSGERVLKPNTDVSEAKRAYCASVGYSDQATACANCWMKKTCDLPAMTST